MEILQNFNEVTYASIILVEFALFMIMSWTIDSYNLFNIHERQ